MDLHRTTFFSSSVCNCCIVNVLVQFRRIPFRSAACRKNTHKHTLWFLWCKPNQTKQKKENVDDAYARSFRPKTTEYKEWANERTGHLWSVSNDCRERWSELCGRNETDEEKRSALCVIQLCLLCLSNLSLHFFFGSVLCIVFDSWRELFFHMHTHTEYGKRWWATKRTTWIKCVHKRGKNCDILWSCAATFNMYIFIRSTFYVSCWAKKTFYLVLINRNDHISVHKVLRLANITVQFGLYAYGGAVNTQVEHICV